MMKHNHKFFIFIIALTFLVSLIGTQIIPEQKKP